MISDDHLKVLAASGITPEYATARGYETITDKRRLAELKITAAGRNVPGLLVPMLRVDGSTWGYQYRPDSPGYATASRSSTRHRGSSATASTSRLVSPTSSATQRAAVDHRRVSRKPIAVRCKACASSRCPACGTGWAPTAPAARWRCPEWRDVALNNDRRVILAFDSDVARKEPVQKALRGLAGYLATKGARIEYLHLPDTDDKTGLDDYLAEHTVEELWRLVKPVQPPVTTKPADDTGEDRQPQPTRNRTGATRLARRRA